MSKAQKANWIVVQWIRQIAEVMFRIDSTSFSWTQVQVPTYLLKHWFQNFLFLKLAVVKNIVLCYEIGWLIDGVFKKKIESLVTSKTNEDVSNTKDTALKQT